MVAVKVVVLMNREFPLKPAPAIAFATEHLGGCLVGALADDNHFLVFFTDSDVFPEALDIFLLNKQFKVLDQARLSTHLSKGIFENLRILDSCRVSFSFLGNIPWVVELFDRPRLLLPFVGEPLGVRRKFRFSRWFKISQSVY